MSINQGGEAFRSSQEDTAKEAPPNIQKIYIPRNSEEYWKSVDEQNKARKGWREKYVEVKKKVSCWREQRSAQRDKEEADKALTRMDLSQGLSADAQELNAVYHAEEESDDESLAEKAYYSSIDSRESYEMFQESVRPNEDTESLGWFEEYEILRNSGQLSDDISIVDFFAAKYSQKMERRRGALLESRVLDLAIDMYQGLESSVIETKRAEMTAQSQLFLEENRAAIAERVKSGSTSFDDLLPEFRKTVFGNDFSKLNVQQKAFVNRFFYAVIDDLVQMEFMLEESLPFLPVLIDNLRVDASYETYKKSYDAEKTRLSTVKKASDNVFQALAVAPMLANDKGNQADLALERISSGSQIEFHQVSPGEYEVVFYDGGRSRMRVINVPDEKGVQMKKYVIEDKFRDSEKVMVEPGTLERTVKSLYLDRIMNYVIEKGRDYLGPNLDAFLPDGKMEALADLLFFPRKIENVNLNETEYIAAFRRLIMLITSDNNKGKGTGEYGDLRSLQQRINLCFHVLQSPETAQKMRLSLFKHSDEYFRSIDLESFMKAEGVEENFGNYSR